MKVEEVKDQKATSIRRFIADLGPKGVMALTGAIAIAWLLLQGNLGTAGLFSGQSPGDYQVMDERERIVERVFGAIDGVDLDEVIIRTETVADVQTSVFSSRTGAEREVVQSVVVFYHGTILHPHDVTLAISMALGVDYHQIQFLNSNQLGGN